MFAAGKYSVADQMCYAEFLRYYYLIYKSGHNDNQPEELTDNLLEDNSLCSPVNHPKTLPLMSSKKTCTVAKCHLYLDIMCLININNQNSIPIIYCFSFIHSGMNLLYCQNVMEHILVN